MEWLNYELLKDIAGASFAQQFFIWSTSLGIAAKIHSFSVKKEVRAQGEAMVLAINNLASALREELKSHSEKIELVTKEVNELKGRVFKLEGE